MAVTRGSPGKGADAARRLLTTPRAYAVSHGIGTSVPPAALQSPVSSTSSRSRTLPRDSSRTEASSWPRGHLAKQRPPRRARWVRDGAGSSREAVPGRRDDVSARASSAPAWPPPPRSATWPRRPNVRTSRGGSPGRSWAPGRGGTRRHGLNVCRASWTVCGGANGRRRRSLRRRRPGRPRLPQRPRCVSSTPTGTSGPSPCPIPASRHQVRALAVDADVLALLSTCCPPSSAREVQVSLTLRHVAGLSTAQIAAAFLVEPAMASPGRRHRRTPARAGRGHSRSATSWSSVRPRADSRRDCRRHPGVPASRRLGFLAPA